MRPGYRRGFTSAERTEMWDRWQRGESLSSIGRAFGKESSSIYFQLSPHGGNEVLLRFHAIDEVAAQSDVVDDDRDQSFRGLPERRGSCDQRPEQGDEHQCRESGRKPVCQYCHDGTTAWQNPMDRSLPDSPQKRDN